MPTRNPSAADIESRVQTVQIRGAARKGMSPQEIADLHSVPIETVERALASADHPRLSDPAHLFKTQREAPGMAPADVQLYWLGFLTAAGRICGHGTFLTLVVTVGEKSLTGLETFLADLTTDSVRVEVCHSSIAGWQVYIRDQSLCKALSPWGVPSDLLGGDPALLDDLPEQFVVPFIRGYADGTWPARRSPSGRHEERFILHGTPSVLAGINALVRKYWAVTNGVVTQGADRAELRFADPRSCRTIRSRLSMYASRLPLGRAETSAGV